MNKVKEVWNKVPDKDMIATIFILMILTIYLICQTKTFQGKFSLWLLYTIATNMMVKIRKNKKRKKEKKA